QESAARYAPIPHPSGRSDISSDRGYTSLGSYPSTRQDPPRINEGSIESQVIPTNQEVSGRTLRDYGVQGQIGQEDALRDYVSAISDVMDETKRVLRKDGLLFLNIGDTYYSGKGKSHGVDKKSNKRRFGLRAVDKSGGLGAG